MISALFAFLRTCSSAREMLSRFCNNQLQMQEGELSMLAYLHPEVCYGSGPEFPSGFIQGLVPKIDLGVGLVELIEDSVLCIVEEAFDYLG